MFLKLIMNPEASYLFYNNEYCIENVSNQQIRDEDQHKASRYQ